MKKIIAWITILTVLVLTVFTGYTYAAVLDNFTISVDKETIHPGEQVVLSVTFGYDLVTFDVKVDFDDAVLEYVSTDVGTGNAEGDKVTIQYNENATPKSGVNVTFKAKEDIKTSNPTEFSVTAENLKSQGGTGYDPITSGKVETVTVEPVYQDYTLTLEHAGELVAGEEADFTLTYGSPMGRPYAKARLEGSVTTAIEDATVKLIGTESQTNTQYDIIDDGWGDPQGYEIGGEDVSQELKLKGTFSKAGDYMITLKLIDREHSDETIAEKTFSFKVAEVATPEQNPPTPEQQPEQETEPPTPEQPAAEELPEELPKTGINEYVPAVIVFVVAGIALAYINKKQNRA